MKIIAIVATSRSRLSIQKAIPLLMAKKVLNYEIRRNAQGAN